MKWPLQRWSFYALGLPYQQAPRQFASTGGFQRQGGEPDPDYFCGHSSEWLWISSGFMRAQKLTDIIVHVVLHWGLTPYNKRNDPSYHPPPAFLHTILSKHRQNLDPSKLWSHVRKPRLDGISEPTLTRTLYEFTGDCFAVTLKGPDGLPNSPNSMRDGQGVLTLPLAKMFGEQGEDDVIYQALMEIAPTFVSIA
jgi:alpha 1,2-mannosyltransferase